MRRTGGAAPLIFPDIPRARGGGVPSRLVGRPTAAPDCLLPAMRRRFPGGRRRRRSDRFITVCAPPAGGVPSSTISQIAGWPPAAISRHHLVMGRHYRLIQSEDMFSKAQRNDAEYE